MKKRITILILLVAIFLTACPKQTDLEKGYKTSLRVSNYGIQATSLIGDLYENKLIDFNTKEKIVANLRIIYEANTIFLAELARLRLIYKDKLPEERLRWLDIFYNSKIIAPLIHIIGDIAGLSRDKQDKIFLAISILKHAILSVANLFGNLSASGQSAREIARRIYQWETGTVRGGN